jgi:2-polyprenyl-3-methyl-5-hydroxy-6-metoxy-1,4-benzoquinol methylase
MVSHFFKKDKIMGLLKKLFTNCACPQGRMGRAMLKFMNLCHAPLTNWGLKLVDIQDGWTMLDIGCGGGATLQRLLKRSKDEFEGYDKDVLHNGNGFIS